MKKGGYQNERVVHAEYVGDCVELRKWRKEMHEGHIGRIVDPNK